MESNGQTEITSKIETDSQIESRMTALGVGGLEGGRIKQKEKELMDMDNSVLITGRGLEGAYGGQIVMEKIQ